MAVQTGGLSSVATDASLRGDGTTGDPLSAAEYAGGAFDSVSYISSSREFLFQALDSSQDQRLSLNFIGRFHGVGGDTFTTGQAFHFGDSCVVDDVYYFYTFLTSDSFSPSTVAASDRFVGLPVLESGVVRTAQIATGGDEHDVLVRTATGHAWMPPTLVGLIPAAVKTAYESNLDTNAFTDAEQLKLMDIEERATTDQTASEIKSDYEGNPDTNALTDALLAKLNTIPADAATAAMVIVDITLTGLPTADANAKDHIYVNYEIPTAYMIHEFLEGGTPPTGFFNDFTATLFNGEWPSNAEAIVGNGGPFAVGEWYWNTTDRQAYRYDQVSAINRLFVHISMETLLGVGHLWLQHGEFESELLIRIDEFDMATIYVGEVRGNLIQLDNTTYTAGSNEHTSYNWELIGGLGSGTGIDQDLVNNLIYAAFASAVQGNTETGITVTYDATDNSFDFVVTGGGTGGGGVYYPIDDSNVGGTRDDVTLSTTQSLAAYVHGMMVFFKHGTNFNGGAMTLDVDGLGPVAFRRSDGAGGREEFALGDIVRGQLVLAVYDFDADVFSWAGGTLGTASEANIGELEGNVALLTTGGRFPRGRLPGDIAYQDGATFSGPVLGPTPTVNGHLTTKQYVDLVAADFASRYYPVGLAGVGGTVNNITLTTGLSLSAYFHGMAVFFVTISGDNTGNVTINVDGIGSRPFIQANQHGFAEFQNGDITSGTPLLAIYDEQGNRFLWAGGSIGQAAKRLVGTAPGNVVGVGSNNLIADSLLPANLARTTGATFTGAVRGPTPTANAHLTTKAYVDTSAGGGISTTRSFYIPPADVVGINSLELSTGLSLSSVQDGDQFHFMVGQENTGAMTIAVDGNTPLSLRKNDAVGFVAMESGDYSADQVEIVAYMADGNQFLWIGGGRGNAARFNVGSGMAFRLPLQGADGRLARNSVPGQIAYQDGATFTGAVAGPTPTDDDHLVTKQYVDLGGANPSSYAPIDDNLVSGTNIISLTTGRNLTIIPHGFLVSFNPTNNSTGPLRLEIDGLANNAFRKSDGAGGSAEFDAGDIRSGEVVFAYYDQPPNTFYWVSSFIGTAGRRSTGTDQGNLAVLGSGGRFAAARLPSGVVYRTGATFTGAVAGPAPTDDDHLATKLYVDANAGTGGGEQHYYPVPDAGVSGVNNIVLTTGQSLTDLTDGLVVSFRPPAVNTGNVTINVDSIGASSFRKNDGIGGSEEFAAGELVLFEVVFAVYSENNNRFFWAGGRLGTATRRNTGGSSGDIALLGAGGRYPASRLPDDVVYEAGATFTGAVAGIDPTADEHFATRGYVDDHDGNIYTGNERAYYALSVTGTNAISITTGESIAALQEGDRIWFLPANTNSGDVSLNLDGTGGVPTRKASGLGGFTQLEAGDVRANTKQSFTYSTAHNQWFWSAGVVGNAVFHNVGTDVGNLVEVQANSKLNRLLLGGAGANAGQPLVYGNGSQQVWGSMSGAYLVPETVTEAVPWTP